MKKKTIIYVVSAVIIGIVLGKNIYDGYAKEVSSTFRESSNKTFYLIQYGVYSSNELMIENTKQLKNYFYYEEDSKYHVLIGVVQNKDLKEKIVKAYDIESEVYMKEEETNNSTFLETLKQYDNLIENTDNKNTIINSEKQILSKYEELILRSE